MASDKTRFLYKVADDLTSEFNNEGLSVFLLRLGAHFNRMHTLYESLYSQHEDYEQHFIELARTMAEKFLARSPELCDLDRQRELNKGWYMDQNWVSTMLYIDRYCKDLKGFQDKIEYIEELGVNYVHLMPILKMPEFANDGGYAVSDYLAIDRRFGTMADIRAIASTFRSKNMLLEMDLVLNHTSDQHEWVQKAIAGDQDYMDMYLLYDDRHVPDLFEQTLVEVFPESAPGNFTFNEALGKWVFTTFHSYQWDLNYANPKVFTEMVKILLSLANHGVDILRLDAVAFMWKRLGTQCQNLEEAHLLLQLFKVCAKITAPGVIFKAEAIVQPREIVKYLGGGVADECEIAYNASLMVYLWDAIATKNKLILEEGLKNIPRLPTGTTWINYIRCHDDIGLGYAAEDIINAGFHPQDHRRFIISYYVGEYPGSSSRGQRFMHNLKTDDARIVGSTASLLGLEQALIENNQAGIDAAICKILLLHSVIISFGGIPLIYYGDEIASINDYSYLEDANKKNDYRWVNRPVFDWVKAEERKTSGSVVQRVFDGLKKMIALRKTMPEFFNENNFLLVENANPHLFTFVRENENHKAMIVSNFAPEINKLSTSVVRQAGFVNKLYDVYEDKNKEAVAGHYILEPYQFLWLKER